MNTDKAPFILATLDDTNYTTMISDGHHQIMADEPYEKGGMDEGLTPKQLLASSLASCTAITLKMYADRKEWAIDEIEVKINYENVYDREDPHLISEVTLMGDLDEKQRERMAVIATKCPIHKILHHGLRIETILL